MTNFRKTRTTIMEDGTILEEDIMDMHDKPPCRDCGAMTEYEAFNMCICNGDKDSCHGEIIWPESSKT